MAEPELAGFLLRRKLDVDPEEFGRALEAALAAAGGMPPYPEPADSLRPDELALLAEGGFDFDARNLGVRDPVLQGALEYAAMRATALTTRQGAARLGVNDSRIRQRLLDRELYGLKVGDEWRLPLFQFEGTVGLVPNIERVIPHLSVDLSPIAVLRWFSTPNPDLASQQTGERPMSPLDWLRSGFDPREVAELAARI